MEIWLTLILTVHVVVALGIIFLVLLQHGKGADMGAAFGSGSSGSLFGATGSANFLSRSTAVCAGVFFVCTLALAFVSSGGKVRGGGDTVLDRPASAASAPASAVTPGAVIPGAAIPGAASAAISAVPAVPAASATR